MRRLRTALLICCVAFPAAAQDASKVHRVGFVSLVRAAPQNLETFRRSLREQGYIEGRNLILEVRSADGRQDRLPALLSELSAKADVLVTVSTATALAAQKATTDLPVIFMSVIDPVSPGIVKSLSHPGGNMTGVTGWAGTDFAGKWVGLIKEAVPHATRLAVLWNPSNPQGPAQAREIRRAAQKLKVDVELFDAAGATALDDALARIAARRPQAMVVAGDPVFNAQRERLVKFAARQRLPAIYFSRSFVDAGGLMAYGARPEASYRRAAEYVVRILKGARPADLPVERPSEFELVINLKAAGALGVSIPRSLLLQAYQVIE